MQRWDWSQFNIKYTNIKYMNHSMVSLYITSLTTCSATYTQYTADINMLKDSACTHITLILQYLYLNFSIFVK